MPFNCNSHHYALAARRANERVAFGKPLAANGSVLQNLGRCRVTLDGARLATLEAARRLDAEGNKVAKAGPSFRTTRFRAQLRAQLKA